MYSVIYVNAPYIVSHSERKKFLRSLVGDCYNHKKGMFLKFNNAIGFSKVTDDYYSEYPVIHTASIESPKGYESPFEIFFDNLHVSLNKNSLVKFYIKDTVIKHSKQEYTFSTEKIAEKFVEFLRKVYPSYIITLEKKKHIRQTRSECVLDYFYRALDFCETCYTVECSSSRLLRNEELNKIESILRECVKYPFHIEQFYCETCAGYHKNSPYHIEIVYD